MERRSAVEGPDLLPARLVFELLPPRLDTADNAVAVLDNLRTRCASSVGGRHIGVIDAVFDIVDSGFEKCRADPKMWWLISRIDRSRLSMTRSTSRQSGICRI